MEINSTNVRLSSARFLGVYSVYFVRFVASAGALFLLFRDEKNAPLWIIMNLEN